MFKKKRKHYEYLAERAHGDHSFLDIQPRGPNVHEYKPYYLNNLGSQGWRYVGQDTDSDGSIWLLFERESVW